MTRRNRTKRSVAIQNLGEKKDDNVSGFYEKISLSFLLGQMPPLKISIDQAFADMSLTNLKFLDDDLITV